jgi:hypothetical protein
MKAGRPEGRPAFAFVSRHPLLTTDATDDVQSIPLIEPFHRFRRPG